MIDRSVGGNASRTNGGSPGGESQQTPLANLLHQGDLVLRTLQRRAAAAQAEAEQAELEQVLSQARGGQSQPLEQWLEVHETQVRVDGLASPDVSEGSMPTRGVGNGMVDAAAGADYWQKADGGKLQRAAEERNQQRLQETSASAAGPLSVSGAVDKTSVDKLGRSVTCVDAANRSLERGQPEGSSAARKAGKSSGLSTKRGKSGTESGNSLKDAPKKEVQGAGSEPRRVPKKTLAAVAKELQAAEGEGEPEIKSRSRWLGVLASVLAHVLLLAALAFVTFKLPAAPAGMALQAAVSDVSHDIVELADPRDVPLPDSELSPVAEPAFDASDALAGVQASLADSLSESFAQTKSVDAMSAAVGSAMSASSLPMNAGASFFGAEASGNCFFYVIDASGSMRGGPWESAKAELLRSLATLKSNHRFYIIFFNRKLWPMPALDSNVNSDDPARSAVYADRQTLARARRWIETIEIGVGAAPNRALEFAIEKEPDAIYLLTDGVTTVDVAKHLRKVNRVESLFGDVKLRTPIHAIAYYSLDGQALLRQLASENGGQFLYVPDPRK